MTTIYDEIKKLENQLTTGETDDGDAELGTDGRDGTGTGRGDAKPDDGGDERASRESGENASKHGGASRESSSRASRDGGSPSQNEQDDALETPESRDSKLTAAANANMRRQNAELKKRLQEATEAAARAQAQPAKVEAQTAPKTAPVQPQQAAAPNVAEPDASRDPAAWVVWKMQQINNQVEELKQGREQEIQRQAEQTKQKAIADAARELKSLMDANNSDKERGIPDFKQAYAHAYNMELEHLRQTNPNASDAQLKQHLGTQILMLASRAQNLGLNPISAIYDYAMNKHGYRPQRTQLQSAQTGGETRPDLAKIAANRSRSASPLQGSGSSLHSSFSPEQAAKMSVGDFSKLTAKQMAEIERQAVGWR
jgi:hypothetical protein